MTSCLPQPVGATNQQPLQQPGVYLLHVVPEHGQQKDWNKLFPLRAIKALGAGQVTLFFIAFLSQIVLMTTSQHVLAITVAGYAGIWCGVFYGISGGLGLVAAAKPGKCSIIGFMVMSIFAALMTIPLLTFAMMGLVETQYCLPHNKLKDPSFESYYWCPVDPSTSAVFNAALCFVAVCEGILATISSALCCRASCCRKHSEFQSSSAMYVAQPANSDPHTGNTVQNISSVSPPQMVPFASGAQSVDPPPAYQEKERPASPDPPEDTQPEETSTLRSREDS